MTSLAEASPLPGTRWVGPEERQLRESARFFKYQGMETLAREKEREADVLARAQLVKESMKEAERVANEIIEVASRAASLSPLPSTGSKRAIEILDRDADDLSEEMVDPALYRYEQQGIATQEVPVTPPATVPANPKLHVVAETPVRLHRLSLYTRQPRSEPVKMTPQMLLKDHKRLRVQLKERDWKLQDYKLDLRATENRMLSLEGRVETLLYALRKDLAVTQRPYSKSLAKAMDALLEYDLSDE